MTKVLVTGADGFVGKGRCRRLLQAGRGFSQNLLLPRMVELLENRVDASHAGASEFAAYAGR